MRVAALPLCHLNNVVGCGNLAVQATTVAKKALKHLRAHSQS